MSRGRQVVVAILIGAAALIYGISPIDLIPDILGPLGFADDLVALLGAGLGIWKVLRSGTKP